MEKWLKESTNGRRGIPPDMEFVQKFTPPDFQVKNFTPSISPNFNSFSGRKKQKMSENGEIYTAGKNFTLPPALTAGTNSTSAKNEKKTLSLRKFNGPLISLNHVCALELRN